MPVTSSEVRNAAFRIVLRGYAVPEVDAFLDRIEDELTRRSGTGPDGEAAEAGDGPSPLALRVLRMAEQAAQDARDEAQREVQMLRAEAEAAAAEVREQAAEAAAELVATARAEADNITAAARRWAATTMDEVRVLHERATAEHERRCWELERQVNHLSGVERRMREQMTATLHEHLRLLQAPSAAPAPRPRAVPFAS